MQARAVSSRRVRTADDLGALAGIVHFHQCAVEVDLPDPVDPRLGQQPDDVRADDVARFENRARRDREVFGAVRVRQVDQA